MVDVLTFEQRRFNMSCIRGRNTKPELVLRRGLHTRGPTGSKPTSVKRSTFTCYRASTTST